MNWTLKNNLLVASDDAFMYEANLHASPPTFFSSYDFGETWTLLKFDELPFELQSQLLTLGKTPSVF